MVLNVLSVGLGCVSAVSDFASIVIAAGAVVVIVAYWSCYLTSGISYSPFVASCCVLFICGSFRFGGRVMLGGCW